jgi:hypothetical protein
VAPVAGRIVSRFGAFLEDPRGWPAGIVSIVFANFGMLFGILSKNRWEEQLGTIKSGIRMT